MRKIFFGIAIELFAILLQLTLKEAAVSLIVGAVGLLTTVFGLAETIKHK